MRVCAPLPNQGAQSYCMRTGFWILPGYTSLIKYTVMDRGGPIAVRGIGTQLRG